MELYDKQLGSKIDEDFFKQENFNLYFNFEENNNAHESHITLTHSKILFSYYYFLITNKNNLPCSGLITINLDKIESIDISFLSLLLLFRKEFPHIHFELEFSIPNITPKPLYFFLTQLFTSSYLFLPNDFFHTDDLNKELIRIITPTNRIIINSRTDLNSQVGISSSFVPLIYINEQTLKSYFKESFEWDYEKEVDWDHFKKTYLEYKEKSGTYAEKVYQSLRKSIIFKRHKAREGLSSSQVSYLYYLKLLADFDILQTDSVLKRNALKLNIEIIKDEASYRARPELSASGNLTYRNLIEKVVHEVKELPPIFMMLFSVLIQKVSQKKVKKNIEIYKQSVTNIFEFSRNLFRGIKEIATNAVEHSTYHRGVMGLRVYKNNAIKAFHSDNLFGIENYFENLTSLIESDLNKYSFLNVSLIDDGQDGIIKKTRDNLVEFVERNISNKLGKALSEFEKDITNINSKQINLINLFDIKDIKLFHQARRSAANLGLLIFSNLITKNRGYFYLSTPKFNESNEIDYCVKAIERMDGGSINAIEYPFKIAPSGTFFNLILPLDENRYPSVHYISEITPTETQFETTDFKELFDFEYLTDVDRATKIKPNSKAILLRIIVPHIDADFGSSEGKQNVVNKSANSVITKINALLPNHNKNIIPVINLNDSLIKEDESLLFRFISSIIISREDLSGIIIYNIPSRLVKDVFEIVEILANIQDGGKGGKFWSEKNFVLFYSYENVGSEGSRLYYSNLLGGTNVNEFKWINNKISHTHFTLKEEGVRLQEPEVSRLDYIKNNILFIKNKMRLYNFELLIEDENQSLFEHSVKALLYKDIKII